MAVTPTDLLNDSVLAAIPDWGQLLISTFALIISIIAFVKSSKAEKLQSRINELELLIKQNEVERIEKEKAEANSACVEARVVSLGRGSHELRVWNSGKAPAYNVTARFDGNPGVMIMDHGKQPFEELLPMKNYTLRLITHDGSTCKLRIVTEWTDANGQQQTNTQMGDL